MELPMVCDWAARADLFTSSSLESVTPSLIGSRNIVLIDEPLEDESGDAFLTVSELSFKLLTASNAKLSFKLPPDSTLGVPFAYLKECHRVATMYE